MVYTLFYLFVHKKAYTFLGASMGAGGGGRAGEGQGGEVQTNTIELSLMFLHIYKSVSLRNIVQQTNMTNTKHL